MQSYMSGEGGIEIEHINWVFFVISFIMDENFEKSYKTYYDNDLFIHRYQPQNAICI